VKKGFFFFTVFFYVLKDGIPSWKEV